MSDEIIKKCIEKNELQLSFWDAMTHYWICVYLLIIPIATLANKIRYILNKTGSPSRNGEIYMIIIPILLSVFFGLLQKKRLGFKIVTSTLDRGALNKIIENTATELGWIINRRNKKFIKAYTKPEFLSGSWGEQVVIIFDNNKILVNSICDLSKKTSLVSMGRNKKNEQTLIKNIKMAN